MDSKVNPSVAEKILAVPHFAAVTCRQSASRPSREKGNSQGGNRRCHLSYSRGASCHLAEVQAKTLLAHATRLRSSPRAPALSRCRAPPPGSGANLPAKRIPNQNRAVFQRLRWFFHLFQQLRNIPRDRTRPLCRLVQYLVSSPRLFHQSGFRSRTDARRMTKS